MKSIITTALSIVLISCAGTPDTSNKITQPENVARCPNLNQYGGYQGGFAKIPNLANVYASPYHLYDLMYTQMGPKAEANLFLLRIIFQNTSPSTITLARDHVKVLSESGQVVSALSPGQVLKISRGNDTKAKNMLEEIGDTVLRNNYSDEISVDPGNDGGLVIAFSLPLPPGPKVQVTVNSKPTKLLICWAPPK